MRHQFLILLGLSAGILGQGCQSKPATPPSIPPQAASAAADTQDVTAAHETDPAAVDTANAMAQKAAAHSQAIAQMMDQRPAADGHRTMVNGNDSEVKWMNPDEFSLSSGSSESKGSSTATESGAQHPPIEPALVKPVIDAAPSTANQVASIAPTRPEPAMDVAEAHDPIAAGAEPAVAANPPPAPAPIMLSGDTLSSKLSQRVKDYPNDVSSHLDYQLLMFLNDVQVPELQSLASLPEEDRELISAVLDGMSNFRNAVRADNNMLLSKKVQPILQMADRLRAQADLYIPAIALCTKVDGYGSYKVIDPPRFMAGKEHPAIVYCEVANFASQLNEQKQWETRLTQEAVLYTEMGLPVWQDKSTSITDVCMNRRHDFFLVKKVRFPSSLTIGRYLLKVTVVDEQASRVAEATVPIQIVAQ